jgi:hypothetical protein
MNAQQAMELEKTAKEAENKRKANSKEYFEIYSNGLIHCSVCTDGSIERATELVNIENPVGAGPQKWAVVDKEFSTGEPNPCPCNDHPDKRIHILFTC